ncbi:unnamed protein product [Ranitomeya imitator]|uniref:Uncharacterized protein n=1 Tax=Ranitomeya imitator TaxID=111125 RepID=A0ABN9LJA5_9NEOB|nr:unnamed protein product [Ranitomeya imitator]
MAANKVGKRLINKNHSPSRGRDSGQAIQRRQARVTVKYDRKELQKRLDVEKWIDESMEQLYQGRRFIDPYTSLSPVDETQIMSYSHPFCGRTWPLKSMAAMFAKPTYGLRSTEVSIPRHRSNLHNEEKVKYHEILKQSTPHSVGF